MTRSTAGDPAAGRRRPGSQPPVFLADPADLAGDLIVLSGPEGRHAADVRRLAAGERVDLTDGAGQLAECVVTRAQRGSLELAVRHRRCVPAPDPAVAVVQAIPKGERGQLAVELMTEAGVDVVVPWAAQRCVVRWAGERGERAARPVAVHRPGSGQAGPPGPGPRGDRPGRPARGGRPGGRRGRAAIVLDPAAETRSAQCRCPARGRSWWSSARRAASPRPRPAALAAAGAVRAHLGPTVLRTSTAGAVAAAVLLSRAGRWA